MCLEGLVPLAKHQQTNYYPHSILKNDLQYSDYNCLRQQVSGHWSHDYSVDFKMFRMNWKPISDYENLLRLVRIDFHNIDNTI